MSINKRILELVELKAEGNKAKFANSIGISPQNLFRIVKQNGPVGIVTIGYILKAYPDVNPKWLITGEGTPTVIDAELDSLIDSKISELRHIQGNMNKFSKDQLDELSKKLKEINFL